MIDFYFLISCGISFLIFTIFEICFASLIIELKTYRNNKIKIKIVNSSSKAILFALMAFFSFLLSGFFL